MNAPMLPGPVHRYVALKLEENLPDGWRYVLVLFEPGKPSGTLSPGPDYEMRDSFASLQSNADAVEAAAVLAQVSDNYQREVGTQAPDVRAALELADRFGSIDGEHHKTWVLDQMVRALTGAAYPAWVAKHRAGDDGPETYDWNEGIAP